MNVKKIPIYLVLLFSLNALAQRQLTGIGEWEFHVPYHQGIGIADASDVIYAASQFGLFSYDKNSGEIFTYSKANGLSDVQINDIEYYEPLNLLMIGYKNGNIDIIQENTITNFNAILRKQIVGEKSINHIYFYDDLAFISTTFGVVVFDMVRMEVKETYSSLGSEGEETNVNQAVVLNDSLYLATDIGVLVGKYSSAVNLLDFNNWNLISKPNSFSQINTLNDRVWVVQSDTPVVYTYNASTWEEQFDYLGIETLTKSGESLYFIKNYNIRELKSDGSIEYINGVSKYPKQIIKDENAYWISDASSGLIQYTNNKSTTLTPQGPLNGSVFSLNYANNSMYVMQGGYDIRTQKLYKAFVVDQLTYEGWFTIGYWQDSILKGVSDATKVVSTENGNTYIGTHSGGIVKISNGNYTVYNDKNSPLKAIDGTDGPVRASAIETDSEENLWVGNHFVNIGDTSIYKIDANGNWTPFVFPTILDSRLPLKIFIDNNDIKWIILGSASGGSGVLVFDDENGAYRHLTMGFENGDLQDNKVNDIAFDKDGAVWMVGRSGVSVFPTPKTIFEGGENNDASKPIFEGRPLMENEFCTSIAIDWGNRKWIGTENGLFLMDETGTEQLELFNMDNSPLPTNKINDLELHPETGELFIATDFGLLTYRTNSSLGQPSCKGLIKVFPNPVTPDFNGQVGIAVLTDDAEIKITDAWGNLVYETVANGGMGSWDLKDYTGNEIASGVYSILVTARGRKRSCAENLAIIR